MSSTAILPLETALRRKVAGNTEILKDAQAFDDLCRPFFNKSSAVKAMKLYLAGMESAPHILACLIYSTQGRQELSAWVESGMPVGLLYRSMLHDGGYWSPLGADFILREQIVDGDCRWDVDYTLFRDPVFKPTVIPGLIPSMVDRALKHGQMETLIGALSQPRLSSLIGEFPEAFAAVSHDFFPLGDYLPDQLARKMTTRWLGAERSVMKMLLHCA